MAAPLRLPRHRTVLPTRLSDDQVEAIVENLLERDANEGFQRNPVEADRFFDSVEKVSFLRIHNVTPRLQTLYFTYVRSLGRLMLDAVLRESYINLVNNIFMRLSAPGARATSPEVTALISEAFMETISLLDDLVMFSTTFPSAGTLLTMENYQNLAETITDAQADPGTPSPPQSP